MLKRPPLTSDREKLVMIILHMLILFTGIFLFLTLSTDLINPVPWWLFGLAFVFSWVLKMLSQKGHFVFLANSILVILFLTIQLVIYLEPATLVSILYWSVAVPVIGSLILNRKSTIFWAVFIFVFCLIDIYYGLKFGPDIVINPMDDNIVEPLIFYLVLCLCLFFFLQLQWKAKRNLSDKNEELMELHNEVQAQNEELQQQRDQIAEQANFIHQQNQHLQQFLDQLIELGNSRNINFGQLEQAQKEICMVAYNSLKVSRASIWMYDPSNDSIVSIGFVDHGRWTKKTVELSGTQYPTYLKIIKEQGLVIADNVYENPATSEFLNGYMEDNSIFSMLDAPFIVDGQFAGVICCEHQYQKRNWTVEDTLILKMLAEMMALAVKSAQHAEKNQLLASKNQEIESINTQLEGKIKLRMAELEKKNFQLTEFAFMNSHILRGPIARLAGLYYLVEQQHPELRKDMIFSHFKNSIDELDQVTKNINKAIETKPSADDKIN